MTLDIFFSLFFIAIFLVSSYLVKTEVACDVNLFLHLLPGVFSFLYEGNRLPLLTLDQF